VGPYLAPNGHDPFVFPPEPLGVTLPVPPPEEPWVDWRDDAALFLESRDKADKRAGGRFVRMLHGRPDTHLFDADLTLTFLATYGHFLYVQRPGRSQSPWHTGELKDRRHSIPFITGDAFRQLADFWCDNEPDCRHLPTILNNESHPVYSRLTPEQSIIVFATCQDVHILLDAAIPLLDSGKRRMVLVVHNGDQSLEDSHAIFLDHPRLTAYFTQNCAVGGALPHRKVVCIPIGLEPRQFSMHGWRPETLMGSMLAGLQGRSPLENLENQNGRFAFAAWSVGTYRAEREPLLAQIEVGGAYHAGHVEDEPAPLPNPDKPLPSNAPPGPFSFVTIGGGGQLEHYHRHMLRHSMVLAPRGNGLDTLRCWEALYLGRAIATKNSTMDPLFRDLPVLIVNEWSELSEELVRSKVREFTERRGQLATVKLYMFYWACELGRAAGRASEFCSTLALQETLLKPDYS